MNKEERMYSSEFLMKKFKEKDITQTYLSELSGVPRHSVRNYLYGLTFPSHDAIVKLGEVLGFTWDEFINYAIR
jgi:plasmid maintenance system antidote protein VapI